MRQLQAAGLLGELGNSFGNNTRADIGLASELGDRQQQQQIRQQMAEYERLALLQSLLGGIPIDAFTGRTQTLTGTNTGNSTTSRSGFSFGWSPSTGLSLGGA